MISLEKIVGRFSGGKILFILWLFIFATSSLGAHFTYSEGAIIRGDQNKKEIALVFTGDEYNDGAQSIIETLRKQHINASFFFTGNYYRNKDFAGTILRLKSDNHYLGAHSDKHLLFCAWENRNTTLVTQAQFINDISANYNEMKKYGIEFADAKYLLPAYEWHNATISRWTQKMGLILVNFTPGTRSNADYATPGMGDYVSSDRILQSILDYEKNHAHGLNGFILLSHIGVSPKRKDKFYSYLPTLILQLKKKHYRFVRIDTLLASQ